MKLAPLTNYELEFIRWRIWEPLKRNQDYRNEYFKLMADYFLDQDADDAFCEKWKLPYHIHPDTEFSELTQAKNPSIVNPFNQYYKPIFDHAAFVDIWEWIVDNKYLRIWIDLESSRNKIEAALKKELDEWKNKWSTFYRGKQKRKIEAEAVLIKGSLGSYLEINVNLEAPRTSKTRSRKGHIEPEINEILTEWLNWEGKKKIRRLHPQKWALCFQVYDMVDKALPYPEIAIRLNQKANTVHKQFIRAWKSIYPNEEFSTKRYRKKEIAKEAKGKFCATCSDRVCEKTGKLCAEIEAYIGQDSVKSEGLADLDPTIFGDKQAYQDWISKNK